MDVTLGVFVDPDKARIALIDAAPPNELIDQSEIDLSSEPIDTVVDTVVSTDRALTDSGHQLVATNVCSSDAAQADNLRDALLAANLKAVSVISEQDATQVMGGAAEPETLVLGVALAGAARAATPDPTMAASAVELPDATMAAPAVEAPTTASPLSAGPDVTAATPIDQVSTTQSEQLAYSQEPEGAPEYEAPGSDALDYEALDGAEPDYETEQLPVDEPDSQIRRRQMLIGSSVAAIAVVGFAALAVSVAITVRPTASQQAIRLQDGSVPGNSFPVTPGQGVQPDGPNWTMVETVPPAGTTPDVRVFETRSLSRATSTANEAAPTLVNLYKDGTVGVANAIPAVPAPVGVDPIPAVGAPVLPVLPDYVTRLIPDFSKVTPGQVLYLVANLLQLNPLSPSSPWSSSVYPGQNLGLNDIGVLAVVPKNQGPLFDTDLATVSKTGKTAIPQEIFESSVSDAQKTKLLPPGTTVIDKLPTASTGQQSATVLGEVLRNPSVLPLEIPETQDNGSIPAPELKPDTRLKLPEVYSQLPEQNSQLPEVTQELPGEPSGTPTTSAPTSSPSGIDEPESPTVTDETTPSPDESSPAPSASVEPKPSTQAPSPTPETTHAPAPTPETTRAPAPAPETTQAPVQVPETTQAPIVTPEAPVQQAPVQQAPVVQEPVVQAPAPTAQAPVIEMPSPTRQAPVIELPTPTLPQSPFGGGLFGSSEG